MASEAERIRRNRERNRDYVDRLKREPCTDCRGRFPAPAMDFDHVDDDKAANIAALVRRGVSTGRLLDELAKTELVCSNCHRVRTARREGWWQ